MTVTEAENEDEREELLAARELFEDFRRMFAEKDFPDYEVRICLVLDERSN